LSTYWLPPAVPAGECLALSHFLSLASFAAFIRVNATSAGNVLARCLQDSPYVGEYRDGAGKSVLCPPPAVIMDGPEPPDNVVLFEHKENP
jgi:hypothetical protein